MTSNNKNELLNLIKKFIGSNKHTYVRGKELKRILKKSHQLIIKDKWHLNHLCLHQKYPKIVTIFNTRYNTGHS